MPIFLLTDLHQYPIVRRQLRNLKEGLNSWSETIAM
jgi:hypothetical protein